MEINEVIFGGTLVAKAGDLGAAAAAQTEAADAVTTARQRGDELLAEAQRQADALLTDAQQAVTTADTAYAEAWHAAATAGWTEQALTDLGYPPPDSGRKRRRPASRTANKPALAPNPDDKQTDADTGTAPDRTHTGA